MPRALSFTVAEMQLLTEALTRAASRHESMAKANPRSAHLHELTAIAMHKLKTKLQHAPSLGSVVEQLEGHGVTFKEPSKA